MLSTPSEDNMIGSIQSLVEVLEKDNVLDLVGFQEKYTTLRPQDWMWMRRFLLSRGYGELFRRLSIHQRRIKALLYLPRSASNDPVFEPKPERSKRSHKELPPPDKEKIIEDIALLFREHFPIFSSFQKEDTIGLETYIAIITNGITTHDDYEVRLAEYLSDESLFMKDFCSWTGKFTY